MVNDEQGSSGGGEDDEEAYDVHEDHLAMAPILQGELKKKQLKKAGKSVSVSAMLCMQHVHNKQECVSTTKQCLYAPDIINGVVSVRQKCVTGGW